MTASLPLGIGSQVKVLLNRLVKYMMGIAGIQYRIPEILLKWPEDLSRSHISEPMSRFSVWPLKLQAPRVNGPVLKPF
jgi:hypothetical protein